MASLWPPDRSTVFGAMLVAIWVVGREVLSELVFGSSGEWLEENTWLLGDFLAWQPISTIIVGIGLVIVTAGIITWFAEEDDDVPRGKGKGPKGGGGDQYKIKDSVVSFDQKGGITAKEVKVQHEIFKEGGDHAR